MVAFSSLAGESAAEWYDSEDESDRSLVLSMEGDMDGEWMWTLSGSSRCWARLSRSGLLP